MKKIIFWLMIWSLNASAMQVYSVKNGGEVRASVFKSGLSRIALQDDRITSIKGLAGEFMIDKNEEIGDIYLKPLASRTSDEMNLYIQSEKGNTYALILTVDSDKPETIRLDATDLVDKSVDQIAAQGNYEQAVIIELIKIASEGIEIKGYSSEVFEEPNRQNLKRKVAAVLEKSYFGKHYRVDVLRVENNAKHEISLHERDLAENMNVVAISIDSRTIPSLESTRAYRVVKL